MRKSAKIRINPEAIKTLMAAKGYNHRTLADAIYYSESSIRLALSKGTMSFELMASVAESLGVSEDKLCAEG